MTKWISMDGEVTIITWPNGHKVIFYSAWYDEYMAKLTRKSIARHRRRHGNA